MSDELRQLKSRKCLVSIAREDIDKNKIQGFLLAYSDALVLIQYVYDFNLDGLMVLRRSDITKITSRKTDTFQTDLIKKEGIFERVEFKSKYDVSDWPAVFNTLGKKHKYVIIEDEKDEYPIFLLGLFEKIDEDSVYLKCFSGAANWDDELSAMSFDDISSFQVQNNYIKMYERHYERSVK
jgi:hypothetical protein